MQGLATAAHVIGCATQIFFIASSRKVQIDEDASNCIILSVYLNALHLLCDVLISTWVDGILLNIK